MYKNLTQKKKKKKEKKKKKKKKRLTKEINKFDNLTSTINVKKT